METPLFQHVRAYNDLRSLGYRLYYRQTRAGREVDYGERRLKAFEVKRSSRIRDEDLRGLSEFLDDYPMAEGRLLYGGERSYREGRIEILSYEEGLRRLPEFL